MPISVQVDDQGVRVGLGELRAGITDLGPLLNIAGNVMRGSIARTFRNEGSPAGSWPKLALSTLKKRGYTSGHKLLILTGRLFGSITYSASADTLTIGTNVPYAAVQNYGSRDYRGTIGPLNRKEFARNEADRAVVGKHQSSRLQKVRYGTALRAGKNGRMMKVRVRIAGPQAQTTFNVREHLRHQNIPPRPFMVFRPEDPARLIDAFEAYLGGKMVNIGRVGAR